MKEVSRTRNTAIVEGLNLAKKHVKSTAEHKGIIEAHKIKCSC